MSFFLDVLCPAFQYHNKNLLAMAKFQEVYFLCCYAIYTLEFLPSLVFP
jgi:hypothetical protein